MRLKDLMVIATDETVKLCRGAKRMTIRILNREEAGINPNRAFHLGGRSKYMPHQGSKECARRRKQMRI
jgi:hypothetical protein